ncbi:MAG TPA: DUF1259 domain-containing protein [Tepidisphaeraceae bacterium]|nr:DUF1259 domain-containing protein [Tepidisphaeraceae bacterium]
MQKLLFSIFTFFFLTGCATALEQPAAAEKPTEERWQPIVKEFPSAQVSKNILSVQIPRTDVQVGHIDLGEIPPDAGLSSSIYFFPCPCGKMNAIGQLCVVDYELNDVIDELRAARIKIASIAPMFLGSRPQMLLIRFQGEGDSGKLAQSLKKALSWMSEDRNQVQ